MKPPPPPSPSTDPSPDPADDAHVPREGPRPSHETAAREVEALRAMLGLSDDPPEDTPDDDTGPGGTAP